MNAAIALVTSHLFTTCSRFTKLQFLKKIKKSKENSKSVEWNKEEHIFQ